MIHQFVSFLFWNLHFWIIFFNTKHGALYLHYVFPLVPVGSIFLMMNWWITCLHGWSGKLWIILLGSGGGLYGVGDP